MTVQQYHVKRVRWVLNQVWNEFYTNKPKNDSEVTRDHSINLGGSSSQASRPSRWAQHDALQEKYADYINAVPKLLPVLGPTIIRSSVALEYKGKGPNRSLNHDSRPTRSGRIGPVTNYPQYTFCTRMKQSIKVWHEYTMAHVPMIGDDEVAKYSGTFKASMWDKEGLDPDCEYLSPFSSRNFHRLTMQSTSSPTKS